MYGCRAREFNDRSPPWLWCSVARKSRPRREGKNYDDDDDAMAGSAAERHKKLLLIQFFFST